MSEKSQMDLHITTSHKPQSEAFCCVIMRITLDRLQKTFSFQPTSKCAEEFSMITVVRKRVPDYRQFNSTERFRQN